MDVNERFYSNSHYISPWTDSVYKPQCPWMCVSPSETCYCRGMDPLVKDVFLKLFY